MQGKKTCCSDGKKRRQKSTLPKIKIDKSSEERQLTPEEKWVQTVYFDFIEKKGIVC